MINNRQTGRRRGRGGQRPPNNQGGGGRPEQGNRIDNRARGNASQLHEKYKTLARDAQMSGDRVTTEYYHQFADHYFRVLAETRSRFEENNPQAQQRRQRDEGANDDDYDNDGGYRGDEGDGGDDNRAHANGRDSWQRDDERPQRQPQPQQRSQEPQRDRGQDDGRGDSRPPRDDNRQLRDDNRTQRDDNRGNRTDRDDRGNRDRIEQPRVEAPQFAGEQPQSEERPRRQRRPRTDDGVRAAVAEVERPVIEADRLPPALSIPVVDGAVEAEPPRRRGRPRKVIATDLPPAA